jgi:hypothetical protein
MADVKTIELRINTNIPDSAKKVEELKTSLKGAKTEVQNFNNETEKTSKFGDLFGQLKQGAESLIPGLKGAQGAAAGLSTQFMALIANPIGLMIAGVVAGLKFLYEAFQSSIAGGKELKAIWAAIDGVGVQLKDAIFGLGRAFISLTSAAYKFITLDFKGAAESIKQANKEATTSYKQLGNAVDGTTAKIIYNLTKQQQAVDKARKQQAVVQSETNKLLVQSREILTDETASINEKRKALAEVTKAEKASSAEKVRIAAEDLRIAKERAKALGGEAEKKSKQELRDLTIALNEAEAENAMTGIKLNKQRKMLNRQETADAKALADERIAKQKEEAETEKTLLKEKTERDKLAKAEREKIAQAERDFQIGIDNVNRTQRVADALEKEAYDAKVLSDATAVTDALMLEDEKRINSQKKAAEDLKKIEAEKLAVRMKALDDLTYIFGAESQLGKAFLIAKQLLLARELALEVTKTITFSTQAAARSAVAVAEGTAQTAKVGFPQNIPLLIGYAAQAAGIFSAIRSAVKSAKSSVALPSMPSISEGGMSSSPASVAPTFNVVGTSGQNQIAQSLGNQAPVKAYVVANDVSSQQSLDRNIVKTATLGN